MKSIEKKHTQQVDFSNPNADKIKSAVTNTPIIKLTAVEWLIDWMSILNGMRKHNVRLYKKRFSRYDIWGISG